jgi:lactam utilization protein B
MLTISPHTLAALETSMARDRAAAFFRWWGQHAAILRSLDRFTASAMFDRYAPEAVIAEIDLMDDEIFLWVAARHLMVDMGGRQYLATMDVIFSDLNDAGKLAALSHISRTISSDDQ